MSELPGSFREWLCWIEIKLLSGLSWHLAGELRVLDMVLQVPCTDGEWEWAAGKQRKGCV